MKNTSKNVTIALIATSIFAFTFNLSFMDNQVLCSLFFLVSFPWNIKGRTYCLWGGAAKGTVVSLFGIYIESRKDAVQLFGIALYNYAGRDALQLCSFSFYQFGGRDAVQIAGISLYQHARSTAEKHCGLMVYQHGDCYVYRSFARALYVRGRRQVQYLQ